MPTILVVDDHASFRRQARTLLESQGYLVVGEASDGRSGIEAARTLRPDVVLLDIGLPDMDGFEVARELAARRPTAGVAVPAVILTSSRDRAAYGPRIDSCPVAGFIAKDELSGPALTVLVEAPHHRVAGR